MKIAILTNIPSPYRVDFFYHLQTTDPEHTFHIIYSAAGLSDRSWSVEEHKLIHSHFLNTKTVTIKKKMDDKHIHITTNTARVLSSIQPQLLVCSEYNPTILQAVFWANRHKIPYISWTDGTLYAERNIGIFQKWARHYVIKGAKAFIASSTRSREAQIAYGANPDSIFVSSLTVDIQKYLHQRQTYHAKNLLYVGSLSERKGLDLLFQALSHVEKNYHLTLVGTGDKEKALIELAEKLNLTPHITFTGFKEEAALEELYHSHDIFILPTREDCFGLVILEAMCASMPVICSQYADGAYDLIEDNQTGFIIDPFDPKSFARAIDALLDHPATVESMSVRAYEKVLDFNFDNVSKGFLDAISYIFKRIS